MDDQAQFDSHLLLGPGTPLVQGQLEIVGTLPDDLNVLRRKADAR